MMQVYNIYAIHTYYINVPIRSSTNQHRNTPLNRLLFFILYFFLSGASPATLRNLHLLCSQKGKKKKKKKNYKYFKKLQNTDEGIGKKKRSNVKLQYCKWLSMCRLIDFGQHAQACR